METVIGEERKYKKIILQWENESREVDKIFCHTCARNDFNKSMLASSWTAYADNLQFLNSYSIRDMKDQSKVIGTMENWKCPKGHGISVSKDKD